MKIFTLQAAVLFASLTLAASHAEVVNIRWEDPTLTQPGVSFRSPELRTVIVSTGPTGIELVNQDSDPVSPFPRAEPALLVQSTPDDSFWFRLNFRPFVDEEVHQGVAEFNLQPVEGALSVQVGSQSALWDPQTNSSYYPAISAFSIVLHPGVEPNIMGRAVETDSIGHILSETNYRVTIKWDFTEGDPVFRVFLNGEVVRLLGSAEPFSPSVSPEASANGINAFRVSLGSPENQLGKAFVGPMRAASGLVPDLDVADEAVFEP